MYETNNDDTFAGSWADVFGMRREIVKSSKK